MPIPKTRIEINPSELALDLTSSTSSSTTLTLTNPSDDEHLLFKVRTTNPKRYLVKPNQELLMKRGSVNITIEMQARECAEILENANAEESDSKKDKFMISTIVADENVIKQIKSAREAGSKELQQAFTEVWAGHGKDDTGNRRIGVTFVLPKGSAAVLPPAKPAPSNPPTAEANASTTSSNGTATKASAAKPAQAPAASPQQPPASMTSVVASHIQTPNKKAEEVVENIASGSSVKKSGEGDLNYDTLARQYKETLATLVQVTEERDRFQQKFKELGREIAQLREDARSTSKSGRSLGDGGESLAMVKSGYQIWHLVLVAMVSFLVAKLMEFSRTSVIG